MTCVYLNLLTNISFCQLSTCTGNSLATILFVLFGLNIAQSFLCITENIQVITVHLQHAQQPQYVTLRQVQRFYSTVVYDCYLPNHLTAE